MTDHPFDIFRPYHDRIQVRLYDKQDDVRSPEALPQPLADGEQVHAALTRTVETPGRLNGTDGLATAVPGLTLATRSADCQCFAVYDPVLHVGGVLHAGWRGMIAGAIPGFISTIRYVWKSKPSDLLIAAGPSLCLECSEFTDPLKELPMIDERFFHDRKVDLRGIADEQWRSCGVRVKNIERHDDCTRCHKDQWWTLRGGDEPVRATPVRNVLTISLL